MKEPDFFTKKEAKNLYSQTKTYRTLRVFLNRLYSMQTAVISEKQRTSKQMRKARTRTLIQMGALVKLSGLSDLCDIQEEEDLQINLESQDKAALLLGLLMTIQETYSEEKKESLRKKGIRKMKQIKSFT